MKKLYQYLTLAAVAVGFCSGARATPTLFLSSDGSTWTQVAVDGGAGDVNSATGQVTFIGSFGAFSLNVHTGTTYPAIGSLTNPMLDLSFNATSSGSGGTIYAAFSADGFGPTHGAPVASVGGTAGGSDGSTATVTFSTYGGNSNTLNNQTQLLTSQGPFSGSFSGTATGPAINNNGPFALTEVIKIVASAGGIITTGDALLSVPDSGTSLLLLGAGLTCLAFIARLRPRFN